MITKRRAISEIFATLMLLAVTVTGSTLLASLVYGSGIQNTPTSSSFQSSYSIKLTGYDTRDSSDLSGIPVLDNKFDKKICTISCAGFANNIPTSASPGTEFLVLQIRNVSPDYVYVKSILINGIEHTWDQTTAGKTLDASSNDFTGKYPANSKFSIIPTSGLVQRSDYRLNSDEEVRIIIKLGSTIPSDISLTKPIIASINFGGIRASENVILSGEIR